MSVGEFFDSDRNLVISVAMVFIILGGLAVAFPDHSPPTQYRKVVVTSQRTYALDAYQNFRGAFITSTVQDIHINMTSFAYTLSCSYYQMNDTLTMRNDGSSGYETNGGSSTPWVFDNLHPGCSVISVQ